MFAAQHGDAYGRAVQCDRTAVDVYHLGPRNDGAALAFGARFADPEIARRERVICGCWPVYRASPKYLTYRLLVFWIIVSLNWLVPWGLLSAVL